MKGITYILIYTRPESHDDLRDIIRKDLGKPVGLKNLGNSNASKFIFLSMLHERYASIDI